MVIDLSRLTSNGHRSPTEAANAAVLTLPTKIYKRDGRLVDFDQSRIEQALGRCLASVPRSTETSVAELAQRVMNIVGIRTGSDIPTVEQVQDVAELVLQSSGEFEAAKHYILYRAAHAKERAERPVPDEVRDAFADSDPYFPTELQKFQFYDKYSRFNHDLGRRETWLETVGRASSFLRELSGNVLARGDYHRIEDAIAGMQAMPSMRLLAMAGDAARRNSVAIYNCSYLPIDSVDAWVEGLLISMAGCGVGYSVESQYVEQFPRIRRQFGGRPATFVIEDTTEGWGQAVRFGIETWFDGGDVAFDYSLIRPAGAPLRVKGGRASGPEPLRAMLNFARSRILARQGSFLRTIDAHDIMCAVGNAAVSGGVRRTAMIALFDHNDSEMQLCKSPGFDVENSQRWNANNSTVWPEGGPTQLQFMDQFLDMVRGQSGEPGIFNRDAALALMPDRRKPAMFGCNPCGEINLRARQFCNLSIAVARYDDTLESLLNKVEIATMIGTIQSLATNFPGLRPEWKQNCVEERLLGVDITGQLDCPMVQSPEVMRALREHVVATNARLAQQLGINQSAATTCVKPSGNSSQLLNCSSGLHARWAPYYIRNVRVSTHGPIYKVLKDHDVPMDPENGQTVEDATTYVVHFPVKSPDGAITRNDRGAIQQCEYWLLNKQNWTEHNPSVTITYRPDEVIDLMRWVWDNRAKIGGMAFLPSFDAQYAQLPYIEISAEQYATMQAAFPVIDWSRIYRHESQDLTTAAQEVACSSGACDL